MEAVVQWARLQTLIEPIAKAALNDGEAMRHCVGNKLAMVSDKTKIRYSRHLLECHGLVFRQVPLQNFDDPCLVRLLQIRMHW